ncbi:hypothetical protein Tco_1390680 [Tanacetum coccineum]
MCGGPRKKIIKSKGKGGSSTKVSKVEDDDLVFRGIVRDESQQGGTGGSQQGGVGAGGSKNVGVSRLKQGSVGGSKQVSAGWSIKVGAGGSKRKAVSSDGIHKRHGKKKVGNVSFARWFGAQDDQMKTQNQDPLQTQDQDQVQTQEQAEIDLTNTQVE